MPSSRCLRKRRLAVVGCMIMANVEAQQVSSDDHWNKRRIVQSKNNQDTVGSCNDLESQYSRLMSLPVHLQPMALKSRTSDWNEEQEVWLCPNQSSPSAKGRVDFVNGLNCQDVELLFSLYTSEEVSTVNPLEALGFDYPSWCQCPGSDGTTNIDDQACELCPNGHGVRKYKMKEAFKVVRGDKNFELSCGETLEYARYTTSEDRCQNALKEARSFCCEPITTTKFSQEEMDMSFEDVKVTFFLIVAAVGFCSVGTFAFLWIMEAIDKYYFSWEYL